MELNKSDLKKLNFIKFIYEEAVKISQKKMPYSSMALLLFHDAIELFLEAATTSYNISSDNLSFMGYWTPISQKLEKNDKDPLSYKEPIRKLNKDRVNLKHSGLYPSQEDLEAHRANTLNFFRDNCHKLFHIRYEEINLIKLIPYKNVRNYMGEAQKEIENDNLSEASFKYSIAFEELTNAYIKDKKGYWGDSLFEFEETPKFKKINYLTGGPDKLRKDLKEFTQQVEVAISEIQDILGIIALGLNYKDYMRFKSIVPKVYKDPARNYQRSYGQKESINVDDLSFCEDFIIESSLSLYKDDFKSFPNEEIIKRLF